MEAIAKLKNNPTSPRKMRLVADLVRGQNVMHAINVLKMQPKHDAAKLEKLLRSAVANWEAKNPETRLEEVALYVKSIHVDGGPSLKRLRPAPQGRAFRILKRSNHVTVVVDSLDSIEQPETEQKPKAKK